MKKFLSFIASIILGVVTICTAGCSVAYSTAACTDKAGRETVACTFEGIACFNGCFSCFCASDLKDCYENCNVVIPLACADCARNEYEDDCTIGCMACAEKGFETYIKTEHYESDYDIEYKTTGMPDGYYKAVVTIIITPSANLKNIVCDFTLSNNDGNVGSSKLYFGTMHEGITYKKSTSFNFKGYGGLHNPSISSLVLGGAYADY